MKIENLFNNILMNEEKIQTKAQFFCLDFLVDFYSQRCNFDRMEEVTCAASGPVAFEEL